MPRPKRVQPDQPIGLKLTVSERLMIKSVLGIDSDVSRRLAKVPSDQRKIDFTLNELDDLVGHIAVRLSSTKDAGKKRLLERLYEKVEHLLKTHTDQPATEEEPQTSVLPLDAMKLDEWASFMLSTAEQSGMSIRRDDCKVVLSQAQRRTILSLESLDEGIREPLNTDQKGNRTFDFTAQQLASICNALAVPLAATQGKYRNQLLKAAEKVAHGLTEGLKNHPKPHRPVGKSKVAYQIKVTLKDVMPLVWRRFQAADCTLPELHEVIQIVMGWTASHLWEFVVGEVRYSDPSLADNMDSADGRRVRIGHIVKQGHRQFEYVYDFGDYWRHEIEIESAFQPEEQAVFPSCLEGAGACPPEDVGGATGYKEFLEIINAPEHEEHKHYLDWCGGWFDPDAFDLETVNRALGRMR